MAKIISRKTQTELNRLKKRIDIYYDYLDKHEKDKRNKIETVKFRNIIEKAYSQKKFSILTEINEEINVSLGEELSDQMSLAIKKLFKKHLGEEFEDDRIKKINELISKNSITSLKNFTFALHWVEQNYQDNSKSELITKVNLLLAKFEKRRAEVVELNKPAREEKSLNRVKKIIRNGKIKGKMEYWFAAEWCNNHFLFEYENIIKELQKIIAATPTPWLDEFRNGFRKKAYGSDSAVLGYYTWFGARNIDDRKIASEIINWLQKPVTSENKLFVNLKEINQKFNTLRFYPGLDKISVFNTAWFFDLDLAIADLLTHTNGAQLLDFRLYGRLNPEVPDIFSDNVYWNTDFDLSGVKLFLEHQKKGYFGYLDEHFLANRRFIKSGKISEYSFEIIRKHPVIYREWFASKGYYVICSTVEKFLEILIDEIRNKLLMSIDNFEKGFFGDLDYWLKKDPELIKIYKNEELIQLLTNRNPFLNKYITEHI